jgi:PAS domain S-box-containing protein
MIFNSLKSRIIISITAIVILSLSVTTFFIQQRAKQELSNALESNALNMLEATLNQVESNHNSILYHKSVMLSRRKIEIKNNITIAFAMVNSTYQRFLDGEISEEKAKQIAKNDLRQMRYDDGVGYFWINDIGRPYPTMLMHPTTPDLVGNVMDDPKYNCALGIGESLFIAFVDVCLEKGEGYVDYLWPKPTHEGLTKEQPKISFVRLFEPWDWIIGTGVYIDDIEKDVQNRIDAVIADLNRLIKKQKIGKSGYFFIFDENSRLLVHPSLAGQDGNQFVNPTTGRPLFTELKEAALSKEPYFEYLWDKPGFEGEYRFPKKAYITYYEDLGWYIGSSVYKEDYEQKISDLTNAILLFASAFIVIAIFISLSISKSITNPLKNLIDSISNTDEDSIPKETITETGTSELKLLSTTINNMIESIRKSRIDLMEQHEYSQNIIDGSPYVICGISMDGTTTYINPPGEIITGYNKDEIIGKNWWDTFYPGIEIQQVEKHFEKFKNGKVKNHEMRLTCKDGSTRDILWNSLIKKDSKNNVLTIFGFGNDVTERKIAEKKLEESEIRYKALFESASDTILLIKEGKFIECNQNALKMYGTTRKDFIGYSPIDFSPEYQPDGSKSSDIALEKINLALEGIPQIFEWQHTKLDGTLFDAEINLNRVILSSGPHLLAIARDITERKRSKETLRKSQELLDLAMSVTNDGIWDWHIEENFVVLDERYYSMAGYHPDDFPSDHEEWRKRIHAEDRDRVTAAADDYLSGRIDKYDVEFRFIKKDSSYMWIHARGKIVNIDEGKNTRFVGTHSDITEQKEAEQALNESEARYRTLVENAPEAIAVIDIDLGIFVDVNENAERLYGLSKNELLASSPAVVSPPYQADGSSSETTSMMYVKKAFEGEPQNFEWSHLNAKTGKVFTCEVFLVGLPSSKRKLVRGSIFDITDRKRQEAELHQLRNYLSNIIDSMPSILIGVDPEGNVTEWNKEAYRTTGILAEEAVGKPLDMAIPRLASEMERVKEAMKRREVIVNQRHSRQEEDEIRYENITVYPLIANGIEGAVIRIDDITDNVRLEEMMIQSEKMLSVGGLAAGMAHEINNPLAGLMQTASVITNRLSRKLDMPANIRAAEEAGTSIDSIRRFMESRDIPQMISTINESGRRVADIVNNMLSFARKSEASVSSFNITDLLDNTLILAATDYDLKKHFDFKTINIIKEYEDNLPPIPCESAKIQQVLLNLLRNGAQAMQETDTKNPTFIIRAKLNTNQDELRLEIDDNGPGMDEKTRKRVFEPFYTTKPVGVGTGLGLSVSYFIITENHGGRMRVESEPGSGANFIINLPLKAE